MRVVAVSVGAVRAVDWDSGSLPVTAIEKRPVDGPVRITADGVEGNACADVDNHGDAWMKVYAYAREDYEWWERELGVSTRPGLFGEQLTTEGVDLNAALVGEVWRVGTSLLQIAHGATRAPRARVQPTRSNHVFGSAIGGGESPRKNRAPSMAQT